MAGLFPVIARETIEATACFLISKDPKVRPLTGRDLAGYKDTDFIAGWQTRIRTSDQDFRVNILLDGLTPFSPPRVGLADKKWFLKWPHFEKGGLLCLRQQDDSLVHQTGSGLVEYYLREAENLIQENLKGQNEQDFSSEFQSYWKYWCDQRNGAQFSVLFFGQPDPPSRMVYCVSSKETVLICDSVSAAKKWLKDAGWKSEPGEEDFRDAGFLWLESSLKPDEYPRNNSDVVSLVQKRSKAGFDIFRSLVPVEPGHVDLIFGFESGNGPALGYLKLNEPIRQVSPKKRNYPRFNGFRKKSGGTIQLKNRFFGVDGKTEPAMVQRIDSGWIFERGGNGLKDEIKHAKVCFIGCGSLGAQVAMILSQNGVGKLVLIDHEILSWDNIGRHLLGGAEAGQYKATALKTHIEKHFPGMIEIQAEPKTWQKVYINDAPVMLKSDVIVSTVADWDAESALNHASIADADFPPVVYGWTEPYGIVGHALVTMGVGGCLSCGMDPYGTFIRAITEWGNSLIAKRPPACGVTYQPYGVIDILPTQNMIARLVLDILLEKIKKSQHRVWIGNLNSLADMEGKLADGVQKYYGAIGQGERFITKDWKVQEACRYSH